MKIKKIFFCLGSNIGDKNFYLKNAIELMEKKLDLKNIKKSQTLINKALLLANSPSDWDQDYFNISISADINLEIFPPQKILEIIKKIEVEVGRIDRGRWSPREIDIDILLIEDLLINEEKLKIPHYDLLNRDFFISTLSEIEPNWQRYLSKQCSN
jgi:2-amino-4-hydroxy-6-hydroxymethyldihydropteridine diphosphokinase